MSSPPASNSGKSARDMSVLFADFTARWLPLLVCRAELVNHLLVRNVVGVLLQGLLFARSNVSLLSNVYKSTSLLGIAFENVSVFACYSLDH